jgi:hypothetical protein
VNRKYILLLMLIPALLATNCKFFIEETASTPEARMEAFVADVNAERWDSIWRHFHPDSDNYDSGDFYTNDNAIRNIFETHVPLTGLYVSTQTATCRSSNDSTEFQFTLVEYETDNFKIRYVNKSEQVFRNEH